jgi:Zn finger protein HypA/HybF involved in hydrogenase expression
MDTAGRVLAIIIVVIIIIFMPIQYIAQAQVESADNIANTLTAEFTDKGRQRGYITSDMYDDYLENVEKTGDMYDIEMEVSHPVTGKEEVLGNLTNRLDSVSDLKSANKSNNFLKLSGESVHVHSADCYAGTLHVCNGTSCVHADGSYGVVVAATTMGLYYSFDGLSWQAGKMYCGVSDVTYGNGKFVAVGGNCSYSSNDGVTWQQTIVTGVYFYKIAYGNGVYLATASSSGYSYLFTSTDGIHWQSISYLNNSSYSYIDVAYANGIFYLTSKRDTQYDAYLPIGATFGTVNTSNMTSYSGVSWGLAEGVGNIYSVNDKSAFVEGGGVLKLTRNWVTSISGISPTSIVGFGNNNYVLISNQKIYTSTTGNLNSWTQIATATFSDTPTAFIYFCGKYLISSNGASGAHVYTSSDAKTWDSTNCPSTYALASNVDGGSDLVNRGTCIKIGKYYDSNGNEVQPICDKVVTSITATNPNQTVNFGDSIVTTATANYLDGHTGTVTCSSNFDKNKVGTQTVTLIYSGLVDNAKTNGTKNITINVIVKPAKSLSSITVSPPTQTVKRYSVPDLIVTAFYSDGSNRILSATEYSLSGFDQSLLGLQIVNIGYSEFSITKTAPVSITVTKLTTVCPVCGTEYELDENDVDQGCPNCRDEIVGISASPDEMIVHRGESLNVTVMASYANGKTGVIAGWGSNYNPDTPGDQMVKITYLSLYTYVYVNIINTRICPTCGTEYDLNDDGTDLGCPKCSGTVVSIDILPKDLTINLKDKLNLTVTVTYLDGHTAVVNGWYTDFLGDIAGTYDVTIYYKKVFDTIKVTVTDNPVTCPYCGLSYNYSDYPKGCPICSVKITGIEASLRDGGTQVIYHSMPNIQITRIYQDTHKDLTYNGWTISGYEQDKLGEQTVTVYFDDFSTTLTFEVIKNPYLITCPICGTQYYLDDDGTDPGCPYCSAGADEGTALIYFDITYTDAILEVLYKDGIYRFQKGDYFTVSTTKMGVSLHERLQKIFNNTGNDLRKESYSCGGEVMT